jgi:molybdopterin converting factor small subunit
MKPMFFKDQKSLMDFIQSCPTPGGEAQVRGEAMGAASMLSRCVALIPQIFEYKKVLAKGLGGIGSNKTVMRYAEVASDSVSAEKMEAFDAAIEAIQAEATTLIEAGGGEELADQLSSVRTKVAYFTLVKSSIEGFRDKLQKHMARVEETYADLAADLSKKKRELSKTLDPETVANLQKEIDGKHKTVQGLVEAMDEYCALQVGYNGILIGSMGR